MALTTSIGSYRKAHPNPPVHWDIHQFKVEDPILFHDSDRFRPVIHNNMKGIIRNIEIVDSGTVKESIQFDIEIPKLITEDEAYFYDFQLLENSMEEETSLIRFNVYKLESTDENNEEQNSQTTVPSQVAYAVSIHKAQGMEYDSVKLVITDEVEELVTHNIFYTAITRARERLKIYWIPEVEEKVISYNKLWKMLIDKGMNKTDLKITTGLNASSIAKLSKGQNITTDVLLKICDTLDYGIEDIIETIKD